MDEGLEIADFNPEWLQDDRQLQELGMEEWEHQDDYIHHSDNDLSCDVWR